MTDAFEHAFAAMGTVVSMRVVGHTESPAAIAERTRCIARAAEWFKRVEACCSRYDEQSELRRLCERVGERTVVSELLFETIRFAVRVAEDTDGAFDPTIGTVMEARGFDRNYRTGAVVRSDVRGDPEATYRDVLLDDATHAVTLRRALLLDLSAVAKGLAVDLAARDLAPMVNFAIDAGGDLFLGGHNADGAPWSVGIRDPRNVDTLLGSVRISGAALCTSGDYERPSPTVAGAHHIVGRSSAGKPDSAASATVMAPSAIVADALATAAFVLGPQRGVAFLEENEVDGLIVTAAGEQFATTGMRRALDDRDRSTAVVASV